MLRDAFKRAGIDGVVCESAGTGDWHVGGGADHRAEEVISRNGLDLTGHSASQFTAVDFDRVDLVLALDSSHVHALNALAPSARAREKIHLLRSFDPDAREHRNLDVSDPYYGDFQDFEITFAHISAALDGIVEFVAEEIAARTQA